MPELRQDPISHCWVIIAKNRNERPREYQKVASRVASMECPFCEGSESQTPGEILAYRNPGSSPDGRGWQVRVVPNKFPALENVEDVAKLGESSGDLTPAVDVHAVIIESPRHIRSLSELSDQEAAEVFRAYRDRLGMLRNDKRLVYGLIFKNVGAAAGASVEHVHSQLMAIPFLPSTVQQKWQAAQQFYDQNEKCIFCERARQEQTRRVRLVEVSRHCVAICPYASRVPYEMCVYPRSHQSHFELTSDHVLADLACLMRRLLARLERVSEGIGYNYLIHTAPFDTGPVPHYHWHVEILPRLSMSAGFEWGTGCFINTVPPEEAAERLAQLEI